MQVIISSLTVEEKTCVSNTLFKKHACPVNEADFHKEHVVTETEFKI